MKNKLINYQKTNVFRTFPIRFTHRRPQAQLPQVWWFGGTTVPSIN